MTDIKYVLLDQDAGTFETFETEADLEEYIGDEYDKDSVEYLQVFEVETEYTVTLDTDVVLEEV